MNSRKTLIHRAYHICSINLHLDNEFNFLLSYFTNNGYSSKLVHSCVRKFLDSVFCPQTILSCDKFKLYVSFPYFGPQSFNLKKDLLSLSNKYFPGISFNFIVTNNLTLRCSSHDVSLVHYLFLCLHSLWCSVRWQHGPYSLCAIERTFWKESSNWTTCLLP